MKNSKAAIEGRQGRLIEYVKQKGSASVNELAENFGVSLVTVRRDLDTLEAQGQVERFFGGVRMFAKPDENEKNAIVEFGNLRQKTARSAIAKMAETFIQDGDTVFLNSSATAMLILDYIQGKHVTIITNNGRSLYCPHDNSVELVLTGGEVYGNKQSLVGQFALQAIRQVRSTKCILGVSGISAAGGITSAVVQETAVNQAMLQNCVGQKIVVADGSKVGMVRNFVSGNASDIDLLITDQSAPSPEVEKLKAVGVEVVLVDLQTN